MYNFTGLIHISYLLNILETESLIIENIAFNKALFLKPKVSKYITER